MEDEKFREILSNYNPELPPDSDFMSRMERNLRTIDMVKKHNMATHRSINVAIAAATIAGIIIGVLSTLLYPSFSQFIGDMSLTTFCMPQTDTMLVSWIASFSLLAIGSVLTYSVYDLTLFVARKRYDENRLSQN